MPLRPIIFALLGALCFIGCAPPALDPDRTASTAGGRDDDEEDDDTGSAADDDEPVGDDDEDTGTGTGTGTAVPASFTKVYNALKTPCGSCHLSGAASAPIFFGNDAATSYTAFKDAAFVATPSPLTERGAHAGRAMSAAEVADVEAWVASE